MEECERKKRLNRDFILLVLLGFGFGIAASAVNSINPKMTCVASGFFALIITYFWARIFKAGKSISAVGKLEKSEPFSWALVLFRVLTYFLAGFLGAAIVKIVI